MKSFALLSSLWLAHSANAQYQLARQYSGSSFFTGWDFYGNYDNLTNGDVTWVTQGNATTEKLAYVNSAGNAIIKVDNTTNVVYEQKRDSVRVTSHDSYPIGTIIVMDALHVPYGCSVWPSFWTKGLNWPNDGEIDIFETINLMDHNQMALHTQTGCTKVAGANQTGTDAVADCSQSAGCTVEETNKGSVGAAFASAGGGVWATQFDTSGVFIWFWNRANVPSNLKSSSLDTSTWGTPSAAYPSASCSMSQFFSAQQLVLDITLCGDWAGGAAYNETCAGTGTTGICYNDNVINAGSPHYDNAYFEIADISIFALASVASSISASIATESSSSTGSGSSPSGTGTSSGGGSGGASAASWSIGLLAVAAFVAMIQV